MTRERVKNGGGMVRTLPGGQKVKRCSGCKVDHPLAAFAKGSGPGGLHRHCREYQREWRKRHKARSEARRY